jgi:hypothetical protein
MKLVRLAVVQLASLAADWGDSAYNTDGVHIQILGEQQRDHGYFVLLSSIVPLQRDPEINTDGYILIPEPERKQGEAAIEAFANLLAVSMRSSRQIFSPTPYVALIPEDHEAHDRLSRTKGILLSVDGRSIVSVPFHVPSAIADKVLGKELYYAL